MGLDLSVPLDSLQELLMNLRSSPQWHVKMRAIVGALVG
jgi:hypothetical protein